MTEFHDRADWGARAPRSVTSRDLTENTAHYGGPSPWGASVDRSSPARFAATADHSRCASIVRAYQAFHMDSRGWQDIAYSSLVCPHGHRYEGRGPNVRTAANGTTAGNNASHATCYIAGDNDPLTPEAMAGFAEEGVRLEGLHKGHRDWKSTACPGDALYGWVHGGQPVPAGSDPGPIVSEEDDNMHRVIGVKGDAQRPFMALRDGFVVKFTDNPELVDTTNGEVWAPKAEYSIGVRAGYLRAVEYVDTGDYDGVAVLAKRRAV